MRALLLLIGLLALAGAASACEGLSPGDEMSTDAGRCTLAFILASPTDLYFATAGHCIQVDQVASSPDHGEIGRGAFHFLEPENGDTSDGSPGMDFGLIRIDPARHADLDPKVCGWEGPLGFYEGGAEGGMVRHYGHGIVFGELGPTTQKREGVFLRTDEHAFYWTGAAVLGDSGSAVLDENGLALGVFTHVLAGVNGIPPSDNGGTRLQRGLDLAKEAGFADLRLVLAGEDPVAVMLAMRGQDGNATAPTPTPPAATPATPPPASSTPAPTRATPPPPANGTQPATNGTSEPLDPASTHGAASAPDAARDTPFPTAPATLAAAGVAAALLLARPQRRKER